MEIREVPKLDTAAVRLTASSAELPQVIGDVCGEILAYFDKQGIQPAGHPVVVYHNLDMEALDVEIGIPVSQPIARDGRIDLSVLPGGSVLYTEHEGPYSTMESTYQEILEYLMEVGHETELWLYETYLSSPLDTPEDKLKIGICLPLSVS